MLLKLLKFVLRTRFSRPFLVLVAFAILYSVGISSILPQQSAGQALSYFGAAIVALLLAMSMATGGVMVFKSDRDYLFTLPVDTRDLSISMFFSQFIAFGITALFLFAYLYAALPSSWLYLDLLALAFTFTSLGIIATSVSTRLRLSLSVGLALWTMASFTGFPITPGSAFTGSVILGSATLVGLAAVATAAAFRALANVELDMMRSLVRSTSAEVKSPSSFAGKSPKGAIYSMNIANMSLAGRVNMAGTSRYVTRRVKTRWMASATTAIGAAYFVLVWKFVPATPLMEGTNTIPAAILVAVLLSLLSFFLSQSAITNERLWLSLTSLQPTEYFRHLIASKLISLLIILVPFAVADAALYSIGFGEALGALAVVLLVVPGFYVIEILWSAYIAPVQIKGDDMSMPAQFSIRQLLTAIPLVFALPLASVSTLFPEVAAVGGTAACMVAFVLTASPKFWGKVVTRLTENGFV